MTDEEFGKLWHKNLQKEMPIVRENIKEMKDMLIGILNTLIYFEDVLPLFPKKDEE